MDHIALLLPASSVYALPVSLEFVPSTQDVSPGSPTEVDVRISGLGDFTAPLLGVFNFDVNFDPTILSFNSVTFGDPVLGDQLDLGSGSITAFTPGIGLVNLFELSLASTSDLNNFQAPAFILASLIFDTIGTGISPLSFSNVILSDAPGDPLTASFQNGSVTAPVPEPSSAALLLAGLVFLARHFNSKSKTRS